MAEVITIPYRPRHPGVHEELEAHRFAVLVAHRRFGKTVLAVNHLLKQAICCRRERGSFPSCCPTARSCGCSARTIPTPCAACISTG